MSMTQVGGSGAGAKNVAEKASDQTFGPLEGTDWLENAQWVVGKASLGGPDSKSAKCPIARDGGWIVSVVEYASMC